MIGLRLLDYDDALAPHFDAINRAWIEEMFVVEPHDDEVLSHPREQIVDRGGTILFVGRDDAILGDEILGAGALMPTGSAGGAPEIELTKMGVSAAARGSGAGAFLLAGLVARAVTLRPASLYLLTNHSCEAAIHLYERAGFIHDPAIMARYGATYQRADVAMSFPLDLDRGGLIQSGSGHHGPTH